LDRCPSIVAGYPTERICIASSNDDATGGSQPNLALIPRLLGLDDDLYLAMALGFTSRRDGKDKK
jgi:hypothetical protein